MIDDFLRFVSLVFLLQSFIFRYIYVIRIKTMENEKLLHFSCCNFYFRVRTWSPDMPFLNMDVQWWLGL